jgi:hypothetical protein
MLVGNVLGEALLHRPAPVDPSLIVAVSGPNLPQWAG